MSIPIHSLLNPVSSPGRVPSNDLASTQRPGSKRTRQQSNLSYDSRAIDLEPPRKRRPWPGFDISKTDPSTQRAERHLHPPVNVPVLPSSSPQLPDRRAAHRRAVIQPGSDGSGPILRQPSYIQQSSRPWVNPPASWLGSAEDFNERINRGLSTAEQHMRVPGTTFRDASRRHIARDPAIETSNDENEPLSLSSVSRNAVLSSRKPSNTRDDLSRQSRLSHATIPLTPTRPRHHHPNNPDADPSLPLPDLHSPRGQPPAFNIFTALLTHQSLTLHFASLLPIPTLLTLYSLSLPFHQTLNQNLTHVILSISTRLAPESSRTFLFKAYRSLCIPDPALRPSRLDPSQTRMVPSLRWLQFVLYREHVADAIVRLLAAEGHRLPAAASLTLKKIWLTMDIATNAKRIGLLHNRKFWTDEDLYLATMIVVKLDMRFTDPVDGDGETALRELLLGQRSLTLLWKCLRGEGLRSRLEVLREWVKYSWVPSRGRRGMSVLGVPPGEVGRGQLEGWGLGVEMGKREKLLRVDEVVAMESVRRGMRLERGVVEMFLWGWVDLETGLNREMGQEEEGDRAVREEWSDWSGLSDGEKGDSDGDGDGDEDERMGGMGQGDAGGEAGEEAGQVADAAPEMAFEMGLL